MEEELASIEKNGTWELVPCPPSCKVIGVKWVYKTKYLSDRSLDKHKACLVAKGYAQFLGIDFDDNFAPIAQIATIQIVLAIVGKRRWPIFQMDVKSTFLNSDLKEEVYVEQPLGFQKDKNVVYRLKKALYDNHLVLGMRKLMLSFKMQVSHALQRIQNFIFIKWMAL